MQYILSLQINVLTDEESGDEDTERDVNHLSPRQLQAGADIRFKNNSDIDQSDEAHASSNVDRNPISQEENARSVPENITREKHEHEWIKGEFQNVGLNFAVTDYSKFSNFSPVQMFEIFWDDALFEYLLHESTK